MRLKPCTTGLHCLAMAVVGAALMLFSTGCGDDCPGNQELVMHDGAEVCASPCSDDGDCADDEGCTDGFCLADDDDDNVDPNQTPGCDDDDDCGDGEVCDDGECVDDGEDPDCTDDDDCADDEICDDGTCVDDGDGPDCTDDDDCPGDEVCEAGTCVDDGPECTDDTDCPGTQVCDNETCVDDGNGPDVTDEELCEAYCELELGCLNSECDLDFTFDIDGCVYGEPGVQEGCMSDINDPDFRSTAEFLVFGDFDDLENEELKDEQNSCEDLTWRRCGMYGLIDHCDGCEDPENIDGDCTTDDDCPNGGLLLGDCMDTTGAGDYQCVHAYCYTGMDAQPGDINRDGGCGEGYGCAAVETQTGGVIGQCVVDPCTGSDECGDDEVCSPTDGQMWNVDGHDELFSDDPVTPESSEAGVCSEACDDDSDCDTGTDEVAGRCNDAGTCEIECGDGGELDDLCDDFGGDCRSVDGYDEDFCEMEVLD